MKPVLEQLFLWLGMLIVMSGAIGVVRARNVYDRLHFSGMVSSAAAPCFCLAALLHPAGASVHLKSLLVCAALFFTGPLVQHVTARAAWIREKRS